VTGPAKEEVLSFGAKAALCGVVTRPAVESDKPAVVLLNSGLVHHVGPHRLYVKIARALAEQGHLVMRVDFSGIGDSDKRKDNVRFEKSAVEDARESMDVLAKKYGATRFGLGGLCSGAEISFKTALEDERVVGAAMINAPQFLEEPSSELISAISGRHDTQYYWRVALFNKDSWKKALSGKAHYGAIFQALGTKVAGLFGSDKTLDEASPDVNAFDQLTNRHVKLMLLLSEVDWGLDYLRAILGHRFEAWAEAGNPRLEIFPHSDHMMTPLASQERTRRLFLEWAAGLESS
jgi:dienelactone hydrolase